MKNTLRTLALFVMASVITISAYSQSDKKSYSAGHFMLQLDGDGAAGVIAPIDNKGNATIDNVKPGTHSVALLVPAVQKIREAAARAKTNNTPPPTIEIESFSWGVSNTSVVVAGSKSISGGKVTTKPTTAPFVNIVQRKGEEYYKIELEDILVSSYQSSGGGSSSDRPMESLSLNFTKIEFKYDLKENKK
jgi:type VI secretion system secreted protein Hcp